MRSEKKEMNELPNEVAIRNLLIVTLLKDNVDPVVISAATGIPEKTIRNKFPMRYVKGQD